MLKRQQELLDVLPNIRRFAASLTGNIAPQSDSSKAGGGLTNSTYPPSDVVVIVLYETST